MKEFNLEKALNGEPVKLRNGRKAFVQLDLTEVGANLLTEYPLRGYVLEAKGIDPICWTKEGKYIFDKGNHINDIVEMWEEPKISIEDLPKPFIPKEDNEYWVISPDCFKPLKYRAANLNHPSILNSNCFKTQEDAQKWLDFMKSMTE